MKSWIIDNNVDFEGYNTLALRDDLFFHYSDDLEFTTGKTKSGNTFIILGYITLCRSTTVDPEHILKNSDLEEFLYNKKFWGGRWAIVFDFIIYTDFTCLYSIFWDKNICLLSNTFEVFKSTGHKQEVFKVDNSHYLNWYITPKTSWQNVQKLMPGTAIDLSSKNLNLKSLEYAEIQQKSELETTRLLSESLRSEARFILQNYEKTWVALSAGYDSRLIYSIFSKLNSNVVSYTHIFTGMTLADSQIPSEINNNNTKIYPEFINKKLRQTYDERTGYSVNDADRNFFAKGQWKFLKKNEVVVRGGILELAGISSAHLEDKFDDFGSAESDAKLFLYALKDYRKFQHDSLSEYLNHYIERGSKLKWSKQLYIDQRIAGWLSYIELGLDLVDGTSLHLGNSEYTINLMLSLPLKNMKVKGFHIDEIGQNDEKLLKIDFNPISLKNRFIQKIAVLSGKLIGEKVSAKIFL
jgi:hypothetical protein